MHEDSHPSSQGPATGLLGRLDSSKVLAQVRLLAADPLGAAVLGVVDGAAAVVNEQRQILAVNAAMLAVLRLKDDAGCRGLRFGDAVACVNAAKGPGGCETSRACHHCGAMKAILGSLEQGETQTGECLLSMNEGGRWEAREFAVRSLPLQVGAFNWSLVTLRDLGDQKRREILERQFIHDMALACQELQGWVGLLQGTGAEATQVAEHVLERWGRRMVKAEAHRQLLEAELGELVPVLHTLGPGPLLDQVARAIGDQADARLLRLPLPPDPPLLHTDPAILVGILCEMVANALEAMPPGGQAQIGFGLRPGPTFFVRNPGCLPPEVADCIFQRSFSTREAKGRGLGTYRMKVLGETILGGKVGFSTSWEQGTEFFIELP
jgi:signal transduction histidine kinase